MKNEIYKYYLNKTTILLEEQALKRQELRVKAVKDRQAEIDACILKIEQLNNYDLEHTCNFCRDIPTSPYIMKYGHAEDLGLIIDHEEDWATCPICNEIVVQWES